MSTGMIIDGVFASEAIDSSGETLSIKGLDITDFEEGRAPANYEHKGHEGDSNGEEIVGKIIYSRKIFKESDCTNDREKMFWQQVRLPFLYGVVRLFDGAGHSGAQALAAMIRDTHANREPIIVGFSIEGSTLSRKDNRLEVAIAKKIALTLRPCNKTSTAALLSDPNSPPGFDKKVGSLDVLAMVTEGNKAKKSEIESAFGARLGGSTMVYGSEVIKATMAGNYNVAPGQLTGGAALQVEDRGIKLKAAAKAALRDWDKVTPFRKFLKAKLPEASDEFIDHFSDLVDEHIFRVKKAEEVVNELRKAGTLKSPKKAGVAAEPKAVVDAEPAKLTIRGKVVKPNPELKAPFFDEKKGVLHTRRGSFPMYIPSRDKLDPDAGKKFHAIMEDPKVTQFHDYAVENWLKAHRLLKAGKLPEEVVMHAAVFSYLSPQTAVPLQELQFGRFHDITQDTGYDPRKPTGFADFKHRFLTGNDPKVWPRLSPEHWNTEGVRNQLITQNDSATTGRKAGDIMSYGMTRDRLKSIEEYHKMHEGLVDLMKRHGADVRSASEELMQHKDWYGKHEAKRARALAAGKPDVGEYPGIKTYGLAPKTSRYAMGMMGGGNVVVPDTHFIRYLHGLDKDIDAPTIEYLKQHIFNKDENAPILNAIDRYYNANHDAVHHIMNSKWGKEFPDRNDANFISFWKNWTGIIPHERSRGMNTGGQNEYTTHRPYWDAVDPHLGKSEDQIENIALRTARQHHDWVQQYGEMPAQMLYFRYLVPQLLEAGARRGAQELIHKAQELGVDLRKGVGEPALSWGEEKAPPAVEFQGRKVIPGIGQTNKGSVHILAHSPSELIAVPKGKLDNYEPRDMIRIPRPSRTLITRYPETVGESTVVDSQKHGAGDMIHHDDIHALVHGFDFGQPNKVAAAEGRHKHASYWAKNAEGKSVYVKASGLHDTHDAPSRLEGVYHNVARDFFGLGKYLPRVGVVHHPVTGKLHAIIEHVEGKPFDPKDANHIKTIKGLDSSGELDKLAIMNAVMGNNDRHMHNLVYGKDGLKLIDHGSVLGGDGRGGGPEYMNDAYRASGGNTLKKPVHPEALKWLQGLDAHELGMQLRRHNIGEEDIETAKSVLREMQSKPGISREDL